MKFVPGDIVVNTTVPTNPIQFLILKTNRKTYKVLYLNEQCVANINCELIDRNLVKVNY